MTYKTADRVYETSLTTGSGDYIVDGAQVGFQSFAGAIGNANLCPVFATDDTNWEVFIGTVLTGPNRVQRTTMLASSNGGAAVNWGVGTRKLRCGLPASMAAPRILSKSVAGGADVALTQDEQRRDILVLTGLLTANINVTVDATVWPWIVANQTTGAFTVTFKTTAGTGIAVSQGKVKTLFCDGVNVLDGTTDVAGTVPTGALIDYGGTVIPSGYLACDGSNVSRATYAALFGAIMRTSVVTFDNVTDKVAWAGHGLSNGDVFKFTTTGAAPTGLTAGTTYFVVSAGANDFQLAATEGGAAINFTTNGTGVLTGIHAPHGDGDGSTTFGVPDLRRRTTIGRGGSATSTIGARLGATGGEEAHAMTSAENASHTHAAAGTTSPTFVTFDASGSYTMNTSAGSSGSSQTATASSGSGTAHNTMQPSLVITKIIKT